MNQPGRERPRPIFTGEYIAFSPFDRIALRVLIRSIKKPFLRILEIGSWVGNGSTRVIIEEIQNKRGVLYCVDHWEGNANVDRHQRLVSEYDIFATFKANVSSYKGSDLVKPLVMSSRDAAKIVGDGSLDLVFIDGDHSYDHTASDIKLWIPKVTPGGILSGHDCEGRVNQFSRDALWKGRNADTVEGNHEFPRVHAGVILAVEEAFGTSAHLWSEEEVSQGDGNIGKSMIWDVRI